MCGVGGGIFFSKDQSKANLEDLANRMGGHLYHRGPDDQNIFVDPALGLYFSHTRLAIIDPSERGKQPMRSSCGRLILTYNGEMYNTDSLREEVRNRGRVFRSQTDTEVLLEGMAEFGVEEFLRKVNGMFAFGAYDLEAQVLWLARDRLGIKPLYYGFFSGDFVFASELNALRAHEAWCATVDRDSVASFLRHGYIPAPYCIYQGISKLLPGHLLRIDSKKKCSQIRYWCLEDAVRSGRQIADQEETVERISQQLKQSVRQQMVSDVPIGAFLSGGIDSSLVAAIMAEHSTRKIKTFSIGFENANHNEAKFANMVAGVLETDHQELYLSNDDLSLAAVAMPGIYDEPFADSSQVPTFLLSKMTSNKVRVALSGDGGDELFGGYDRYFTAARMATALTKIPQIFRKAIACTGKCISDKAIISLASAIFGKRGPVGLGYRTVALLDELAKVDPTLYPIMHGHWANPSRVVINAGEHKAFGWEGSLGDEFSSMSERWQFVDTLTYLPDDILAKVDRASMANSLEVRVPLLDHELVEMVWRYRAMDRSSNTNRKAVLKDILSEYLPKPLIDRKKMGFGIPLNDLLRGKLRNWVEDHINPQAIKSTELLDNNLVQWVWSQHRSGKGNWGYWIWDIVMLQAWLAEH